MAPPAGTTVALSHRRCPLAGNSTWTGGGDETGRSAGAATLGGLAGGGGARDAGSHAGGRGSPRRRQCPDPGAAPRPDWGDLDGPGARLLRGREPEGHGQMDVERHGGTAGV